MTTELISRPYIEITLNLMARFGVEVQRDGWQRFTIAAGQRYRSPGVLHVEGDASAASYFLAAGAIGGGPVRVEGVGSSSIQGDVRFADALQAMGARIEWGENFIEASAPAAGKLKAFDLDLNHIPDAAMTLAVAALFADGRCVLRNIASWRVKETDRIAAMATELRKLGATVEEGADYIAVSPPPTFQDAVAIDTYDDHRMAMCFSLAALGGVPVTINDPALRQQDLSRLLRRPGRNHRTGDRHRRAFGFGQGHGRRASRRALGLSLSRQRLAVSPDRAGRDDGRSGAG